MSKHKLNDEVEDILQHFGVKGMRWGVRRSNTKSGKGSFTNKSKKTGKNLGKAVLAATGIRAGNPNTKLNTKAERVVDNILHYPLAALNGSSASVPSHRQNKRVISRGEKLVDKYGNKTIRGVTAALDIISG